MIPGTVCILSIYLSIYLSLGLHMCVGIILWLKNTYHLQLDATKETDLFTARTKFCEMTLKLCVIYLTLTCFILGPDRPMYLHLVFQPKYAYICIRLCMCVCIWYTLCVACYSTFACGSKWLCCFPPPQVTPSISMSRCSTARSSLMNWRFLMVHNPFLHLLHLHTHAYSDPALIYVFLFKIPTVQLIRYIILNSHLGC